MQIVFMQIVFMQIVFLHIVFLHRVVATDPEISGQSITP